MVGRRQQFWVCEEGQSYCGKKAENLLRQGWGRTRRDRVNGSLLFGHRLLLSLGTSHSRLFWLIVLLQCVKSLKFEVSMWFACNSCFCLLSSCFQFFFMQLCVNFLSRFLVFIPVLVWDVHEFFCRTYVDNVLPQSLCSSHIICSWSFAFFGNYSWYLLWSRGIWTLNF